MVKMMFPVVHEAHAPSPVGTGPVVGSAVGAAVSPGAEVASPGVSCGAVVAACVASGPGLSARWICGTPKTTRINRASTPTPPTIQPMGRPLRVTGGAGGVVGEATVGAVAAGGVEAATVVAAAVGAGGAAATVSASP